MALVFGAPKTALNTAATAALAITGLDAQPIGQHLIVGTARATTAASQNGVASMTVDTNTAVRNICHASRAATLDVCGHLIPITDAIEAADALSITHSGTTGARKVGLALPVTGITGGVHAASAGVPGLGDSNIGSNGFGTSASGGNLTTTIPNTLLVAFLGFGNTGNTVSGVPVGWTLAGQITTNVGTSDRGIAVLYATAQTAGAYALPATTLSVSGGWAVCMYAYPYDAGLPPVAIPHVVIGGVEKIGVGASVIVGGVKRPVVTANVLIGGVKKPLK